MKAINHPTGCLPNQASGSRRAKRNKLVLSKAPEAITHIFPEEIQAIQDHFFEEVSDLLNQQRRSVQQRGEV